MEICQNWLVYIKPCFKWKHDDNSKENNVTNVKWVLDFEAKTFWKLNINLFYVRTYT